MKKGKAIALVSAGLVAGLMLGSVGVSYAATDSSAETACVAPGARLGQSMRDAGARLIDVVAGLTGLSVDEVKAARADGQSIAEIAEANGSSGDAVVGEALSIRKQVLDGKVADGSLTQEQADAAYDRMSERLTERITTEQTGQPAWAGAGMGAGRGQGARGVCGNQ